MIECPNVEACYYQHVRGGYLRIPKYFHQVPIVTSRVDGRDPMNETPWTGPNGGPSTCEATGLARDGALLSELLA